MESFVLPANFLEQGDSPGSTLFLAAGPPGFLAGARVDHVFMR